MNAQQELQNLLLLKITINNTKTTTIKCAKILVENDDYETFSTILLKIKYTLEEYNTFLSELDFEYDSGFGTQRLLGTIWFEDGTWAAREEYDGSEWWTHYECPKIPVELIY